MSDLRSMLDDAAGAPGPQLRFAATLERARRQQLTRRLVGAVSAVGLVVAALFVALPSGAGSGTVRVVDPADGSGAVVESSGNDPDGDEAPDAETAPRALGGAEAVPSARPSKDAVPSVGGGPRVTTPGLPVVTSLLPAPAAPPTFAAPPPSSERLAFVRDGIYLANADGTDEVRIAEGHRPAWSPDGRQLALIVLRDPKDDCAAPTYGPGATCGTRGHLAVMNADGTGLRIIRGVGVRRGVEFGYAVDAPTWSPDGTRIAFVQRYCGQGDPMEVNGDLGCRPPEGPGAPISGASTFGWSELRAVDVDGRSETVIATAGTATYNESPDWSARGVVFTRAGNVPGSQWDLHVAVPGGATTARTKTPDQSEYEPAWSPDGLRIAFDRRGEDSFCSMGGRLWTIRSDDGEERPVGEGGSCNSEPTWAMDGTRLVFTRTDGNTNSSSSLWITGLREPRRIVASGFHPAFRTGS